MNQSFFAKSWGPVFHISIARTPKKIPIFFWGAKAVGIVGNNLTHNFYFAYSK